MNFYCVLSPNTTTVFIISVCNICSLQLISPSNVAFDWRNSISGPVLYFSNKTTACIESSRLFIPKYLNLFLMFGHGF